MAKSQPPDNQEEKPIDDGQSEIGRRPRAWGGRRPGAGRLPNDEVTLWLQLGVPLTEDEDAELRKLTPGQRRHRLIYPNEGGVRERAAMEAQQGYVERKQRNYRVVLEDLGERITLLKLETPERRWRLLTPPVGGQDPPDERKGVWDREKFLNADDEGKVPESEE